MSWITNKPIGRQSGVTTVYHFDPASEKSYLSYHQDVADILDTTHNFRTEGQTDHEVLGRKVAEIPAVIYMEWCRLAGVPVSQFMRWKRQEKVAFLKKFLNDPDWYKFRTVDGKI